MEQWAELYTQWKALMISGESVSGFQRFFVLFYQAFLESSRWKQYLGGVGTTLIVTAMALILGIVLGIVVAVIRTAHAQQRPGHHNPLLGIVNLFQFAHLNRLDADMSWISLFTVYIRQLMINL